MLTGRRKSRYKITAQESQLWKAQIM